MIDKTDATVNNDIAVADKAAISGVISKDTRRYVAKYSRAKRINKLVRA